MGDVQRAAAAFAKDHEENQMERGSPRSPRKQQLQLGADRQVRARLC